MTDTDLSLATQDPPPVVASTPEEVLQSMQAQASGLIAMDVEAFSNGFMQIMLAGIGWASAEIAKTKGVDGEDELTFFTEKLSVDLPLIIQNVTAASTGDYTPPAPTPPAEAPEKKRGVFPR